MTFDWYEKSKLIFKTKTLDESENKINHKYLQEIYFLRFLLSLEYSKDQIKSEWKSITNGTSAAFEYDSEEQNTFFEKQYKAALCRGKIQREDSQYVLFQEEIDYLNSLQAPLWFRQYLLGVLILYKIMKNKYSYVKYSIKWGSWILKQCKGSYQYYRKSDTINSWNKKCNFPIKFYPYDNKVFFEFKKIKIKTKNPIVKSSNLEKFSENFILLEEKTFICTQCGEKFEKNEHSRRDICDICYHKERLSKTHKCRINRNGDT